MRNGWGKPRLRMLLAGALGILCLTPPVQHLATDPSEMDLPLGQRAVLQLGIPGCTKVKTTDETIVQVGSQRQQGNELQYVFVSKDIGEATVSSRVFGIVPWKSVRVHVVPPERVYVGGQSIGVRLQNGGAMIVGFQRLGATQSSPAVESHLQLGDVIERIDTHIVHTVSDVRQFANEGNSHGPLLVLVRRGTEHVQVSVHPFIDAQGLKHLGVFVRERTTGVGTLTFYEPLHHRFGALGHIITDIDTGLPIDGTGSLYEAEITGLMKGEAGRPGEKKGRFNSKDQEIGKIEKNTPFGVFGSMATSPPHLCYGQEYPVALPSQVHPGLAKILTVLHGEKVEEFSVQIENLNRQTHPTTKSMVIRVTDSRLLTETGGIVQGMSGSPIIQDGRLVGAVTHVFVSDPTRGYGVYAQWMLSETNLTNSIPTSSQEAHAALAYPHLLVFGRSRN